jgi:DNA phosphorothioation-dependent restriction protein DptG
MTLELTNAEKVVLLDSIETRQIRIQQLIEEFKVDKFFTEKDRKQMIEYYERDLTILSKLLTKVSSL